MRRLLPLLFVAACAPKTPRLENAAVLISGHDVANQDCRNAICPHNENVDLTRFAGDVYLVHRTALSQVLGPNSALHVYRSTDDGKTFSETAVILAPDGRDLRDPHFYLVGDRLFIEALTRLPVNSIRDSDVDTITVITSSQNGVEWEPLAPVAPKTWSFWRVQSFSGRYYSAAYEDGDKSVVLYASDDGRAWRQGPVIYGASEHTPLETELTFMPSGKLMALVRLDGADEDLWGENGKLATAVCWADPPYERFDCPQTVKGQRLDGPLSFFWQGRLFHIGRKHLKDGGRKRAAVYEIENAEHGGPITIKEHLELPSAGDTAYAGAVQVADDRMLISWYSSDLDEDQRWIFAVFALSDIWTAELVLR
jgi:hypothetical protein